MNVLALDVGGTTMKYGIVSDKLEIISVSHVFGESIKRIVDGSSLSSMFI